MSTGSNKRPSLGDKIRAHKRLIDAKNEFETANEKVARTHTAFVEAKERLLKAKNELDEAKNMKEQADNAELHEVSELRTTRTRVQVRDEADMRRVRVGRRGR